MAVAQGGNILRAIAKVIMLLFVARMVIGEHISNVAVSLPNCAQYLGGAGCGAGDGGTGGVLGYWYGGVLGEEGWPQVVWVAESA